MAQRRVRDNLRQQLDEGIDDLIDSDLSNTLDPPTVVASPRILYIDPDDDLATLLDRVEDAETAAIIVLPDGARAVHGVVAARLLSKRAEAAGIPLAAVTTDRTAIAQLSGAGILCAPTVGEARTALAAELAGAAMNGRHATRVRREPAVVSEGEASEPIESPMYDITEDDAVHLAGESLSDDDGDNEDIPSRNPVNTRSSVASTLSSRGPLKRRWTYVVTLVALLSLLGIVIWVILFPRASVAIRYHEQAFNQSYSISLSTGRAGSIALHHTHLQLSDSRVVAGTGITMVPDKFATGSVTFANQLDGIVIVPAGTTLATQSGSRYFTTAETRVPGALHSFSGTTNGQATVSVVAAVAGDASNVGPGAIVSIEGRLAGALLVTNYAAIAGGTLRPIYRLTAADLAAPIQPLRLQLYTRIQSILTSRYSKSPVREFDKPITLPTAVRRYILGGKSYARVTVAVRVNMSYVHNEDLLAVASRRRAAALNDKNQRIVPGSDSIKVRTVSSGPHPNLVLQVTARTAPSIDVANLRALLTGRSIAEARQLLDGSAQNGDWQYSLSTQPDFAARLPIVAGLISITVTRVK